MITKVRKIIKKLGAQGFFVSNSTNVYYLTGFRSISQCEREAFLVITPKRAELFVPKMYYSEARKLPLVKSGLVKLLPLKGFDSIVELLSINPAGRNLIFFEGHDLTFQEAKRLRLKSNLKWRDGKKLIENVRSTKTPTEIKKIRRAVSLTDQVFEEIIKYLRNADHSKVTELDLVEKIKLISNKVGGEGLGFNPIVASGRGSAEPHHQPSGKQLEPGNILLIDIGVKYKDYTGDLTRCVFLGRATREVRRIYETVLECNKLCIKKCRSGMTGEELNAVAVNYFKKKKTEKYFLHSLGHGVGLQIHESPAIRQGDRARLKSGMVITIEPGLYFENKFGVRIEDLILMTAQGSKVLSEAPKELFEIY
jgi:Xaa-Pro aminopeptidase